MEEGKGKACAVAKEKLLNCIMKSDCFQKYGFSGRECLKPHSKGYDMECWPLTISYFECKRSWLDNRQRFRRKKGE